jgi:hypothetical protein
VAWWRASRCSLSTTWLGVDRCIVIIVLYRCWQWWALSAMDQSQLKDRRIATQRLLYLTGLDKACVSGVLWAVRWVGSGCWCSIVVCWCWCYWVPVVVRDTLTRFSLFTIGKTVLLRVDYHGYGCNFFPCPQLPPEKHIRQWAKWRLYLNNDGNSRIGANNSRSTTPIGTTNCMYIALQSVCIRVLMLSILVCYVLVLLGPIPHQGKVWS